MSKPPKHSKPAIKAHPAPVRERFRGGEEYAEACLVVSEARAAFDAPKLTTAQKLDEIGVEAICDRIESGESQAKIAESIGVNKGDFCRWIAADPKRSARTREARVISARHWDDQAEKVLLNADEAMNGSIAKARELASHYRWRASKYAPKDYGEKLDFTGDVTIKTLTDDQLKAKIESLSHKLGLSVSPVGAENIGSVSTGNAE